jgi:hypothetical protein
MQIGKAELIILAIIVAVLIFVFVHRAARQRRDESGRTPVPVPAERGVAKGMLGSDSRDRYLVPVLISVASGEGKQGGRESILGSNYDSRPLTSPSDAADGYRRARPWRTAVV